MLNLSEWAAIAEIAGSVGVIVSLVFLVQSIRKNTVMTQSANDNFLYELQFARGREVSGNPSLAALFTKVRKGEALTEVEDTQLLWDSLQQLSTWEVAFVRHRDGVFSDSMLESWEIYFRAGFLDSFSAEQWEEVRTWYGEAFRSHVDAVYSEKHRVDH
jgi:hypothetical protein